MIKPNLTSSLRSYLQKVTPFFILFVAIQTIMRVILLIREQQHFDAVLFPISIVYCMFSGLCYDALSFLYFLMPLTLLLLFLPKRTPQPFSTTMLLTSSYFLFCYLLLFIAVSEWFFWDEFRARFNFIAVDYLIYTRIVAQYINEAYPVIPILVSIGAAALVMSVLYCIRLKRHPSQKPMPSFFVRLLLFLLSLLCASFIFFAVPDAVSTGKTNRYLNEIGKNGIFSFFKAYLHNELPFQQFYVVRDQKLLSRLLQQRHSAKANGYKTSEEFQALLHTITARAPEKRYNIVLVVMESMSAQYLQPFQQRFGLTPQLDALAQNSLLFKNVYATGTRTVYGLSAIALSIPPIPGNAIIRRPHNEHLFNLASVLRDKGYVNKFIYGGYGYFDNMNYFFENNGYHIIDRTKFKENEISFSNVWGICDEDVFNRVLRENDHAYQQHQPFFDLIMTTSNHRPFTYPENKITIPSGSGREGGLNYADYAIGKFMQNAKKHPWFDNTIFVFVADHTADNAGRNELSVSHYHIPLLFYAPKLIPPRIVTTLASQIDVAPTLLALLQMNYQSKFFGHDILTATSERAFISNYQKIAYLTPKQFIILQPGKQVHSYRREGDQFSQDKHVNEAVLLQALSYFQSATLWQRWSMEQRR